ncbi:alpha/beta hydrolase [Rhodococcus rhodochrous]|uniref:Alpha/beta hydrolase n=1 Tax=Rhodococcus rhodochrous TaxID=1829 RepID=A0AA46X1D1_RHORH|nr:alpha/beta hydrolase [Rhodococcus rhodochrous]MCB8913967.1 alpha/beta hydrolase [Rhodococcus rhodochrous]UZF48319.1 alpha/beta hydrolase [Rhodococcus rhodochrous]
MSTFDPYTGRIVADDALASLHAFRSSGGQSFHMLGVDGARARYEASCRTNGLNRDPVARVEDVKADDRFRVRIYDPRSDGSPSPVILFIHGGGWVMGSLDTHDGLCRRLATRTGYPVVAVDYRLAPEHRYPAAIDDCRTALQWVSASPSHGLTPTSIVLVGDSAGGQLAASLAIEATRTPSPVPICAQVLLYPVTDLTSRSNSYERVNDGFPLVAETMEWFADLYIPPGVSRTSADLSPLHANLPEALPPAYVCTVDNDPLADEGILYAAALSAAGTEVSSVHLAGYAHGLFTSAGTIARGEQMVDKVASFINEVTVGRNSYLSL